MLCVVDELFGLITPYLSADGKQPHHDHSLCCSQHTWLPSLSSVVHVTRVARRYPTTSIDYLHVNTMVSDLGKLSASRIFWYRFWLPVSYSLHSVGVSRIAE